jgi:DNA-binding LytR/AlgR family response regulator
MAGIKVLLVEDDWIIAKEISYTLQDLGFEVIGSFDTGEEALNQLKNLKPDVILLDIDLSSEMTGIDVAKKLKEEHSVPFIFLTALADSATIEKAKLAEPYAYLVKPVNRESLYSTIEITLHNAAKKHTDLPASPILQENLSIDDGIFIKINKRLEKVMLREILWIEAYDIYAMIYTPSGKHLLNSSLKVVEEKFPASKFIRTHRSYIINLDKIDAIEEADIVIKDTRIPIGKTYREKVLSRLSFF